MQASARAARGPCVGVKRMVYLMLASDPTDASGCRSGKWILIDLDPMDARASCRGGVRRLVAVGNGLAEPLSAVPRGAVGPSQRDP